jgi:hypothetical protein
MRPNRLRLSQLDEMTAITFVAFERMAAMTLSYAAANNRPRIWRP